MSINKFEKTRIIGLDETGNFDNLSMPDCRFICGIVLDDYDKEAFSTELVKKFENFCAVYNSKSAYKNQYNNSDIFVKPDNKMVKLMHDKNWTVSFPESFHGGNTAFKDAPYDNTIKRPDKGFKKEYSIFMSLVNAFNTYLQENTIAFLKNECKKNNKKLKIWIYILPDPVPDFSMDSDTSNILDLSMGDNLYEEMAITAVENLTFYDVDFDVKELHLNAATKVAHPDYLKMEEFKKSYAVNGKGSKDYFAVTDTVFYRTALRHSFDSAGEKKIDVNMNVASINYDRFTGVDKSEVTKSQAFHYLSDIIGGYLRGKIWDRNNNIYINNTVVNDVEDIIDTDDDFFDIRFFSKEDILYKKMLTCFRNNNIAEYYALKYDFNESNSSKDRVDYYNKYFVSKIDEKIKNKIEQDDEYCNSLIGMLNEYWAYTDGFMGPRENKYEKGRYIATMICNNIIGPIDEKKAFKSKQYRDKYVFRFYDIIIRGNNHRGAVLDTKYYSDECEKLINAVGMEEYQEHMIRVAQVYFNSLKYDNIIEDFDKRFNISKTDDGSIKLIAIDNYIMNMSFMSNRKDVDYKSTLAGKIYSTLGQAYAFLGKQEAESCFKQALYEMEDDNSNADITRTYLAHHYIDKNNKSGFEEIFSQYTGKDYSFDADGLVKSFDYLYSFIKKDASSEIRFAIYLYLKSIRKFYMDEAKKVVDGGTKSLAEYIAEELSVLRKDNKSIKSGNDIIHPYELIYKNIYEILDLIINDNTDDGVIAKRKMEILSSYKELFKDALLDERRIEFGPTIIAIIEKFKLDYLNSSIKDLSEKEKDNIKQLKGIDAFEYLTEEEVRWMLEKKLTYMYD